MRRGRLQRCRLEERLKASRLYLISTYLILIRDKLWGLGAAACGENAPQPTERRARTPCRARAGIASHGGAEACSDRRIMLAKSLPLGNSFAALKPPPRWSQIHARTSATKSARPRSVMTVGRPPGSRSAAARRALGDNVLSAPRKRECTVVCRLLSHLAPPCIVAPAALAGEFCAQGEFWGDLCVFWGRFKYQIRSH